MDAYWPQSASELVALQERLAKETPPPWPPPEGELAFGSCFVCFERGEAGPGHPGDRGWAAAVLWRGGQVLQRAIVSGVAPAGYEAGLLALREGPLLAAALEGLDERPDVLLVNATGRDHPRRAGMAVQLGWALDVPSVGVTHRPLLATAVEPGAERGDRSPLTLGDGVVGYLLRTKTGTLPLAVHAGWRTDPESAAEVAMRAVAWSRTPEPLRLARQGAREARAAATRD